MWFNPFNMFGQQRRVLIENEYVALFEEGGWYVLENKPVKDLPIVHRGETKTLVNMVIEMGMYPNGDVTVVRAYYPKTDVELQIVVNAFHQWTRYWLRKRAEYEKLRSVLGEGGEGGGLHG